MNETPRESSLADRSTTVKFTRWLCSWRTLRRIVAGLAIAATLIALLFAEENWRGKRAWEQFKREWEAKGERFDLAAFIPKSVPDEQNFAMTPLLAPLLDYRYDEQMKEAKWKDSNALQRAQQISVSDQKNPPPFGRSEKAEFTDLRLWQQYYRSNTNFPSRPQPGEAAHDVLFALAKFDPVVQELREANRRPYAIFPVHFDENYQALLPYLAVLKKLSVVLRLRATALLETGQLDEAVQDITLSFRLAEVLKPEPLLISQLVRISITQIAIAPVWEGLAKHQWKEPQLVELQRALSSLQILEDYGNTLRGERAFSNDLIDKMRRRQFTGWGDLGDDSGILSISRLTSFLAPSGWLYHNQLNISRLHQENTLRLIDAAQHRVFPDRCRGLDDLPEIKRATPYNVFARLLFPAVSKTAQKTAFGQTMIDQATVACALERYRIAHGEYPENLAVLAPRFLKRIPSDVINGEPLKYRRMAGGQFVLYSVGWNEKDDGGVAAARKKGSTPGQDLDQGDWIWQYPAR